MHLLRVRVLFYISMCLIRYDSAVAIRCTFFLFFSVKMACEYYIRRGSDLLHVSPFWTVSYTEKGLRCYFYYPTMGCFTKEGGGGGVEVIGSSIYRKRGTTMCTYIEKDGVTHYGRTQKAEMGCYIFHLFEHKDMPH